MSLEALERLKGAVAYFDGLDPILQKLSGQISISANDLRSLLSSYEAQGERLREVEGWRPIGDAPRDGTPFYARHQSPYRWQPYKPTSEQYRRGQRGRWQTMTEYGGWENCPEPVGDWKPHPDFPVAALTQPPAMEKGE